MRPYKSLAALAAAFLIALTLGPGGTSAPPDSKDDRGGKARVPAEAVAAEMVALETGMSAPVSSGPADANYMVLHVEFKDAPSCTDFGVKHRVKNAHVLARFQKWADLFLETPAFRDVPAASRQSRIFNAALAVMTAVSKAPGYVWSDLGSILYAPPPPALPEGEKTRDVSSPIVRGGIKEGDRTWTGKGVLVAIVDSGIDFRHPDFIRYDDKGRPTSRILTFWDTTWVSYGSRKGGAKSPFAYPNGTPLGTLYTRDELTAQLRGAPASIPTCDLNGHGTACASIAAGNGNAAGPKKKKDFAGVAPEADIIAVRIGGGPGKGLANASLLGAICAWLDSVAKKEGKPYVVSCSFGGQYGGRDGYRVLERQLDARFAPDASGRALCIAAGNEGDYPLHAEAVFGGSDAKKTLRWVARVPNAVVTLYFDTSDKADLRLTPGTSVSRSFSYTHGLTETVVWGLRVERGKGEITLSTASGKRVGVHAYISDYVDEKGEILNHFDGSCAVHARQIATPATTANAITVGSYDFDNTFDQFGRKLYLNSVSNNRMGDRRLLPGELSGYSNPGPRRLDDKVIKPDIVAPGQWYTAAAALNVPSRNHDTTGLYRAFNGTSAATPHVAGIIALLLEKNKKLTGAQIKELLRKATQDDKTGRVPNSQWGYGKLDRAAAERILKAVPTP